MKSDKKVNQQSILNFFNSEFKVKSQSSNSESNKRNHKEMLAGDSDSSKKFVPANSLNQVRLIFMIIVFS